MPKHTRSIIIMVRRQGEDWEGIASADTIKDFRKWVKEHGEPGVLYFPMRQIAPEEGFQEVTVRQPIRKQEAGDATE